MSWQDDIKQPYTITTGDGKLYRPMWNPQRSVQLIQEFNIAKFNFKGVKGTKVDRGDVMGNVYDIEIYFTGATHLVDAAAFRKSAANKQNWIVQHPYYGKLLVQPVGMRYDNSDGNITRINGQIIETIDATQLQTKEQPGNKVYIDKLATDQAFFDAYVADAPQLKVVDLNAMTDNIGTLDTSVSTLTKISEDYNKFKDLVNTALDYVALANGVIAEATTYPALVISSIQAIITAPIAFVDSEANRLKMLYNSYVGLYHYLANLPRTVKRLYENNAGIVISSMCLCAFTYTPDDYRTRPQVISVITQLLTTYNDFIANLDTLSTEDNGEVQSYQPDFESMDLLASLVYYSVSELLVLAASAQQQVTYTLPEDDTLCLLAKRLYGSSSDDNEDRLVNDNALTYKDMFIIKKGREIIYYV